MIPEQKIDEAIKLGLPKWVVFAISAYAYDEGHSAGEEEVKAIFNSMVYEFIQYKIRYG